MELRVKWAGEGVSIVAVHSYEVASFLAGRVPVILHGHDHRLSVREEAGTVVVDAGTTGGAGLRGLASEKAPPLTVALLHFAKRDGESLPELVAVDTIRVSGVGRGFTIERRLISGLREPLF